MTTVFDWYDAVMVSSFLVSCGIIIAMFLRPLRFRPGALRELLVIVPIPLLSLGMKWIPFRSAWYGANAVVLGCLAAGIAIWAMRRARR